VPHVTPHPPQFALSVWVLAQYGVPLSPPQNVCEPAHVVPQFPPLHTSPDEHVVLQEPQLCGSVWVSLQVVPH